VRCLSGATSRSSTRITEEKEEEEEEREGGEEEEEVENNYEKKRKRRRRGEITPSLKHTHFYNSPGSQKKTLSLSSIR